MIQCIIPVFRRMDMFTYSSYQIQGHSPGIKLPVSQHSSLNHQKRVVGAPESFHVAFVGYVGQDLGCKSNEKIVSQTHQAAKFLVPVQDAPGVGHSRKDRRYRLGGKYYYRHVARLDTSRVQVVRVV